VEDSIAMLETKTLTTPSVQSSTWLAKEQGQVLEPLTKVETQQQV